MITAKIRQIVIGVLCMVGLFLVHGGAVSQTDDDGILSVAWRPDGLQIATGHIGGDFRLWNAATGDLLNTFFAPEPGSWPDLGIRDVEWNPDGTSLAVLAKTYSSSLSHLWVVDATTGKTLHDLETEAIYDAAWSPDGTLIASAVSKNGETPGPVYPRVHLWDVATGHLVAELEPDDMTFTIAWSPDGSRLASIGMAYATIFDMQTRTALVRIGELPDRRTLLWVTWSPDGTRVATPGLEGLAYLWDATTGDLLMILQSNDTEQVYQVEWQPGGNLLVGLNDYALIFWDTTTGQQVGRLATPDRAVHVAWSPDGTQLAYGGAMGSDLSMVSVEQIVNAP